MKRFALACGMLGTGCLWANPQSESLLGYSAEAVVSDDGDVEGAAVHGVGGYAGLVADGELSVREVSRAGDPDTYRAATLGFSLRGSLFGILSRDHRIERYFDVGSEAGVGIGAAFGVPPRGADDVLSGWYGAWTELGTFSVGSGYLAVTGGIRREAFESAFTDRTHFLLGLAWRKRRPVTSDDLDIHD